MSDQPKHPVPWTAETEYLSAERKMTTGSVILRDADNGYVTKVCEAAGAQILAAVNLTPDERALLAAYRNPNGYDTDAEIDAGVRLMMGNDSSVSYTALLQLGRMIAMMYKDGEDREEDGTYDQTVEDAFETLTSLIDLARRVTGDAPGDLIASDGCRTMSSTEPQRLRTLANDILALDGPHIDGFDLPTAQAALRTVVAKAKAALLDPAYDDRAYDDPEALHAALKAAGVGVRLKVTQRLYDYMLGVLPPIRYGQSRFDFAEGAEQIMRFHRGEPCQAELLAEWNRG